MTARELIWSHRYADAITKLKNDLDRHPKDEASVQMMAIALRANGDYAEALSFFERAALCDREDDRRNTIAPGRAIWQIDVACLYWLTGDHIQAVRLMRGLVTGVIDGSIKYANDVGAVSQGILLYYMAITDDLADQASFAREYLKSRVKQGFADIWPYPLAQHCLGELSFDKLIEAANHLPKLARPDPAKVELSRRRRLAVALFHGGVSARALGDEARCLARMRECCGLRNPILEQEWYLARYEVQRADDRE